MEMPGWESIGRQRSGARWCSDEESFSLFGGGCCGCPYFPGYYVAIIVISYISYLLRYKQMVEARSEVIKLR